MVPMLHIVFCIANILFYRTSIETDKDKKHRKFLASKYHLADFIHCFICHIFSMGYTSNYTTLPEIVNFHLLRFTGSCMILGIGFILNQITSTINYNVSIGTMVILGIHWMFIGVFNFAIEKYLHIDNITYSTFIAFIISLLITAINYPLIIFCKKHIPLLLGKIRIPK